MVSEGTEDGAGSRKEADSVGGELESDSRAEGRFCLFLCFAPDLKMGDSVSGPAASAALGCC